MSSAKRYSSILNSIRTHTRNTHQRKQGARLPAGPDVGRVWPLQPPPRPPLHKLPARPAPTQHRAAQRRRAVAGRGARRHLRRAAAGWRGVRERSAGLVAVLPAVWCVLAVLFCFAVPAHQSPPSPHPPASKSKPALEPPNPCKRSYHRKPVRLLSMGITLTDQTFGLMDGTIGTQVRINTTAPPCIYLKVYQLALNRPSTTPAA